MEVYLELRNVSDVGNPIDIYYNTLRPILSCEVVGAEGDVVARTNGPASIMQPPPFWLVLPYDSSLRFRVSVSGYGVPKDAGFMVQMPCGDWVLKPSGYLQVVVTSTPVEGEEGRRAWHGTLALPKVRIAP
jgi:hypothetical protein